MVFAFKNEDELDIIDNGSGSGNTVFPLMDCYPNAQIVASDLSLPILKALRDYYDANYGSNTCFIVQLNAQDMIFEEGTIDLIVGGTILHHLFEPFVIGNQIVYVIFEQLIQLDDMHSGIDSTNVSFSTKKFSIRKSPSNQVENIPPKRRDSFRAWCFDLKPVKAPIRVLSNFKNMDDK